jgi:hypothetical protein
MSEDRKVGINCFSTRLARKTPGRPRAGRIGQMPAGREGRPVSTLDPEPVTEMPACRLSRQRRRRYFLPAAAAAPGFALAIASGTLPAVAGAFFLSAFGFFTSRLLLF